MPESQKAMYNVISENGIFKKFPYTHSTHHVQYINYKYNNVINHKTEKVYYLLKYTTYC